MEDKDITIMLTDAETGEEVPAYVIEETTLNGKHYLLVTTDGNYFTAGGEEETESEVLILREIRDDDDSILYECVTDDQELSAIGKVFEELLDDTEVLV